MAKNNNLTDFLTDIANTIRAKKGITGKINPQNFSSEIQSISGINISDTTATVDDVLEEKYFYNANNERVEGKIRKLHAQDMLMDNIFTLHYAQGYYDSAWDVRVSDYQRSVIIPENIKKDVVIMGIRGEYLGAIRANGVYQTAIIDDGEVIFEGDFVTIVDGQTQGATIRKALITDSNIAIATNSGVGGETINIYRTPKNVTVTLNLSNVMATTYATTMTELQEQSITITPNTGYMLPQTIAVSGASYEWTPSSGVLTISKPTSNVIITIVGEVKGYTINYKIYQGNAYIYDGRNSSSPMAGYASDDGSVTITSGYMYVEGNDNETYDFECSGGVSIESQSGSSYLCRVTGNGSISGGWGCFVKGTRITLADNTTKKIEDITYNDELLVWDFDKGDYGVAKPLWIKKTQSADYYYNVKFESGDSIKLVGSGGNCHRLFSIEDGEFIYANKLVGKEVYTQFGADRIISCDVVYEPVEFYNIITDTHLNLFAEECLTSCRYNNIYPIENMKFVKDDREIIPFESYDVPYEYYVGMRLGEQKLNIEKTNRYVKKLISTQK